MSVSRNQDDAVLTGQVPVWPECKRHREVSHDGDGAEEWRWCHYCGWNRVLGVRMTRPNGGWGTP